MLCPGFFLKIAKITSQAEKPICTVRKNWFPQNTKNVQSAKINSGKNFVPHFNLQFHRLKDEERNPQGYTQKRFIRGGSAPRSSPQCPFIYTIFDRKIPVYIPLTNVAPSAYLVQNFTSLNSNCCKCTIFKIWIDLKTRTFLNHKMHLSSFSGLFTNRNDRYPYPFIHFNK